MNVSLIWGTVVRRARPLGLAVIAAGAGLGIAGSISSSGTPAGQAAQPPPYRLVIPALARDGAVPSRPGDFVTAAAAAPAAGSSVAITVSVTAKNAELMIVDVEIYAPSGSRVFQEPFFDQPFRPGQTRTYQTTFVPAPDAPAGTYTVKVGLFSTEWADLYHWNNHAVTFTFP